MVILAALLKHVGQPFHSPFYSRGGINSTVKSGCATCYTPGQAGLEKPAYRPLDGSLGRSDIITSGVRIHEVSHSIKRKASGHCGYGTVSEDFVIRSALYWEHENASSFDISCSRFHRDIRVFPSGHMDRALTPVFGKNLWDMVSLRKGDFHDPNFGVISGYRPLSGERSYLDKSAHPYLHDCLQTHGVILPRCRWCLPLTNAQHFRFNRAGAGGRDRLFFMSVKPVQWTV